MLTDGDLIDVHDLPEHVRRASSAETSRDDDMLRLAEVELRHVRRVLERVGGNKTEAARILGVNRATIYRMLGGEPPEAQAAAE